MKKLISISAILMSIATNAFGWQYQSDEDKMTGKKSMFAYVTSKNSLSLGFPYQGHNPGTLTIRRHPQYGLDIFVSIRKGQILCRSYENCTIKVKFDDEQPKNWSGIGPDDHSTDIIFLRNEAAFIAKAKKAKKILISIPFYQNGNQVLEFYPSDVLKWDSK